MQTTSGVLLGLDPCPGRACRPARLLRASVVELEDSLDLDHVSAESWRFTASCALDARRAHARTGERVAMASYLGTSDKFDASMVSFAQSYADQNEADYEQFLKRITVS